MTTERYCPAWGPGSPVCPRSICDCFIDQFPDDMVAAGALHPEFYTVVLPEWFKETPESLAALAEERQAVAGGYPFSEDDPIWERCTGECGREYRYPYLCRKHMLCGECHEGVPL